MSIQFTLNGEAKHIASGTMLAALVSDLSLAGKRYAIERNGEIVPKSALARTELIDGDRLEIVVAVGGG
jgi:sulfur carrier protein